MLAIGITPPECGSAEPHATHPYLRLATELGDCDVETTCEGVPTFAPVTIRLVRDDYGDLWVLTPDGWRALTYSDEGDPSAGELGETPFTLAEIGDRYGLDAEIAVTVMGEVDR